MDTHVENKMGRWGATSYIIGNMLGSGIFITPTGILESTNSIGLSLVVWTLSAFVAALGACCYVELGTSIRRSGSDFAYMCYVRWNAIGFVFMASACMFTFPLTLTIQAGAFSEYLVKGLNLTLDHADCASTAEGCWRTDAGNKLIGFSLICNITFGNYPTFVARFQMLASVAKLLSAAIIVVTGFYYLFIIGKTENLRDSFVNSNYSVSALANAFFAGLYSYDGWDILNFGAEDLDNPRKLVLKFLSSAIICCATIIVFAIISLKWMWSLSILIALTVLHALASPITCFSRPLTLSMLFAVVVGISTIAMLYISINLSYFTVLTVSEIRKSIAVATTFAQQTLGSFHYFMPLLVSIVLIGSLNSSLFAASRCMFAAARESQLPPFIGCKNARHDSPRSALFFHVVLAMIFSFIGDFNQLINYVAFGMWMQRCFTMCALLYIRIWHVPVHPEAIHTPLIFPMCFLAICLTLVMATITANFSTSAVGLTILSCAAIAYALLLSSRSPLRSSPRVQYVFERVNRKSTV